MNSISRSLKAIDLPEEQRKESLAPEYADVFAEYERPLYNYLLRMTQNKVEAEGLTQETFIRVYRSLSTFRGESSFSTWLYRIATSVSLDHFRRRATQQAKAALPLEEVNPSEEWVAETPSSPEKRTAQSEMSAYKALFRNLPHDWRIGRNPGDDWID